MIYLLSSIEFLLFFVIVFILYWIAPQKLKNWVLLAACYAFYASWNWKFLSLILISTLMNYFCGFGIYNAKKRNMRKFYLALAITTDLSILAFFKYFNFFTESLVSLSGALGFNLNLTTLNIILPLGISFYTFETISYSIDVYRKKFRPAENLIDFAVFVAYFPKLISGPIERARTLMPQIQAEKRFKEIKFREGIYLFTYGLFKKIVIANSLAPLVDKTFALSSLSGGQIIMAAYAFAVQLYCDFSGYIDMARGVSKFFGIELSMNFNLPYFARSPSDFWRRWHITLSSWVRDYIYIPLGGNKSRFFGLLPLLAAWLAMGLWHGAAMKFILWGLYWFLLIIIYRSIKFIFSKLKLLQAKNIFIEIIKETAAIIIMLHLTVYGWLIFRSQNAGQAIAFTKSLISGIDIASLVSVSYLHFYAIILFLMAYEIIQFSEGEELFLCRKNFYYQLAFYLVIFFMYIEIGSISNIKFLYFQF